MGEDETRERVALIERVRAQQERHRQRNRIYRFAFAIAGFAVLLAGVIMLVTPGPGIPVLILGLAMLALEFAWAERWLERLLIRAERAVESVAQGSPARRAAFLVVSVLGLAAVVTMVVLWDVPLLPG